MSKVLYIAHYRESSGYGSASLDYIRAMDAAGIDLVIRPVKLGTPCPKLPDRILELEARSAEGCDVCIQHVLPHLLVTGNFKKHICMYATETDRFEYSGWPHYINMMDEAWVFNNESMQSSINSGVTIPIKVVPHACDLEKYQKPRTKLYNKPGYNSIYSPDFMFYFIGEYNQRKNIPALLRAFHTEFDPGEAVNLLIKTNSNKFSPSDLLKQVVGMANKIKEDLRLYPSVNDYKQEIIMTDYLSNDDVMNLHYTGDCFICPSHGEAWCIPAFDAMAMGKTPICTNVGGMADYVNEKLRLGQLIDSTTTQVMGVKDTFDGLFIGREIWQSIDIFKLRQAMRKAYSEWKNPALTAKTGIGLLRTLPKYSHLSIGKQIKTLVEV